MSTDLARRPQDIRTLRPTRPERKPLAKHATNEEKESWA